MGVPGFWQRGWNAIKKFGSRVGKGIGKAVNFFRNNVGRVQNAVQNVRNFAGQAADRLRDAGFQNAANFVNNGGNLLDQGGQFLNRMQTAVG